MMRLSEAKPLLVPKGTPGAIPLSQALRIKKKEIKICVWSDESREKVSRRLKKEWATGERQKKRSKRVGRFVIEQSGKGNQL